MQQLGETRIAMGMGLMQKIEKIINETKLERYYILVHAKPYADSKVIKQKILIMNRRPPMMLACMLFSVDNVEGKLVLEWALPGDWPVEYVGDTKVVPETVASYDKLTNGLKMNYQKLLSEIMV